MPGVPVTELFCVFPAGAVARIYTHDKIAGKPDTASSTVSQLRYRTAVWQDVTPGFKNLQETRRD